MADLRPETPKGCDQGAQPSLEPPDPPEAPEASTGGTPEAVSGPQEGEKAPGGGLERCGAMNATLARQCLKLAGHDGPHGFDPRPSPVMPRCLAQLDDGRQCLRWDQHSGGCNFDPPVKPSPPGKVETHDLVFREAHSLKCPACGSARIGCKLDGTALCKDCLIWFNSSGVIKSHGEPGPSGEPSEVDLLGAASDALHAAIDGVGKVEVAAIVEEVMEGYDDEPRLRRRRRRRNPDGYSESKRRERRLKNVSVEARAAFVGFDALAKLAALAGADEDLRIVRARPTRDGVYFTLVQKDVPDVLRRELGL